MTEFEKDKLAMLCGYSEDRYTDKVKEGVKRSEYDKDKEHALHRKMLKAVIDKVAFGKEIPTEILTEYMKYYEDIEGIKAEAKETLEIG